MRKIDELSAENLMKEVKVDAKKWSSIPSDAEIAKTAKEIEKRGVRVTIVKDSDEALAQIKSLIPSGSEIMNGSSTTLREIGFVDLLKTKGHGWNNMHEAVLAEKDADKQADMRRRCVTAEYFLSSVNAIAKTGELIACDKTGSRVGAFPFAAKHLLLVSGANKIVPTLPDALDRLREYCYPLENARSKKVYGTGSSIGKIVIVENEVSPGRITLILVKERLGF